MENVTFFLIALFMVVSALGVVLLRNPIQSALCLIFNFLGVAVIYALLDAHFLAGAQVVVYAGAIMVLVMFVLMLLNAKADSNERTSLLGQGLAALVSAGLLAHVLPKICTALHAKVMQPVDGSAGAIGLSLFREHLFAFEVSSLLITAAVVGAVYLGRKES